MREFELALKAVGDPTRTRILKLLESGGLYVCQVHAVLGLAHSTVSRHLTILMRAGLVEDLHHGKWTEYRLYAESRNPHATAVLALLRGSLAREPSVLSDRRRLRAIKAIPMTELRSLPAARVPMPARATARAGARKTRGGG